MELNGGGIEVGDLASGQHFLFVGNGGEIVGKPGGCACAFVFKEPDLVGEAGASGRFGNISRAPPVVGGLIVFPVELGDLGGAAPDASSPFGVGAVDRVVDEGLEAVSDRVALSPNNDFGARFVKLFRRRGEATDVVGGIVVNPRSLIAVFVAVVIRGCRTIDDGDNSADRLQISFGAKGSDLTSDGILSRKFFRMLAVDSRGCFVTEEGIGAAARGIIAFC